MSLASPTERSGRPFRDATHPRPRWVSGSREPVFNDKAVAHGRPALDAVILKGDQHCVVFGLGMATRGSPGLTDGDHAVLGNFASFDPAVAEAHLPLAGGDGGANGFRLRRGWNGQRLPSQK